MNKPERIQLSKWVDQLLVDLKAVERPHPNDGHLIDTEAGIMSFRFQPMEDRKSMVVLFCRFEDIERAKLSSAGASNALNPYSGKYNLVLSSDCTALRAFSEIRHHIRRIVPTLPDFKF